MARATAIRKKPATRKTGASGTIRTFRSAINHLNTAVNFERTPRAAEAAGGYTLGRMQRLLKALDHPERSFKSVHIVGSKGKGSTVAMLEGMLRNCGMRVGVYTSPHILTVRERITVGGKQISEGMFVKLMNMVACAATKPRVGDPTYFELLTAIAFLHFSNEEVDVAVVEAGLGGRLDATNVLKPEAIGVTSISIDHTLQLGTTLESIATEKAGVFKSGVPISCSPQRPSVERVLRRAASEANSVMRITGRDVGFSSRFESTRGIGPHTRICVTTPTSHFEHVHAPLPGDHQALNCALALGVLDTLKSRGLPVDDHKAVDGLSNVRLAGRMEIVSDAPRVMVDGAHNAASIDALVHAIGQNVPYDSMVIIFGCQKDKDFIGMLNRIRFGADKVIFTSTGSPRSMDPVELGAAFAEMSPKMHQVAESLEDAMSIARRAVTRDDLICITGSFYLVGHAKRLFAK